MTQLTAEPERLKVDSAQSQPWLRVEASLHKALSMKTTMFTLVRHELHRQPEGCNAERTGGRKQEHNKRYNGRMEKRKCGYIAQELLDKAARGKRRKDTGGSER